MLLVFYFRKEYSNMENEENVNLSDMQEILHSDLSLDEIEKLKTISEVFSHIVPP